MWEKVLIGLFACLFLFGCTTQKPFLIVDENVSNINDLNDVSISSPSNNQVLAYQVASQLWVNSNQSGGSGDVNGTDINPNYVLTPRIDVTDFNAQGNDINFSQLQSSVVFVGNLVQENNIIRNTAASNLIYDVQSSRRHEFRVNNALELQLFADFLEFNNGATQCNLGWATNGQLDWLCDGSIDLSMTDDLLTNYNDFNQQGDIFLQEGKIFYFDDALTTSMSSDGLGTLTFVAPVQLQIGTGLLDVEGNILARSNIDGLGDINGFQLCIQGDCRSVWPGGSVQTVNSIVAGGNIDVNSNDGSVLVSFDDGNYNISPQLYIGDKNFNRISFSNILHRDLNYSLIDLNASSLSNCAGDANHVLNSVGDCVNLSGFDTGGGAGGTPGGSDTEVQFNDSGSFGGDSTFTFDKDANTVIAQDVNVTSKLNLIDGNFTQCNADYSFCFKTYINVDGARITEPI